MRKHEVDIARGIGIIMVVVGHMHVFFGPDSFVYKVIYSMHMPLFLFLSGYIQENLNQYKFKSYIDKKIVSIVKPYIVFSLLMILVNGSGESGVTLRWIQGMVIGIGTEEFLGFDTPIWFLPMFFVANIVFFFMQKVVSVLNVKYKDILIFVLSMILVGIGLVIGRTIRYPWAFEIALVGQIFICIGYYSKTVLCKVTQLSVLKSLGLFLTGGIVWAIGLKLNGTVNMNNKEYNNIVLYIVTALAGCFCVYMLANYLKKVRYVREVFMLLGKKSLYIMIFHVPATTIILYPIISNYMPAFIQNNMWNYNIIGITYTLAGAIILSLIFGGIYEKIARKQ